LLYEVLKQFNFTPKTTSEIFSNLDGESGNILLSNSYRLIKDRKFLILTPLEGIDVKSHYYIDDDSTELIEPVKLKIEHFDYEGYQIPKQENICAIDADMLSFPLILRHWQNGDYFQPIGMKGMKKVSDFFIDSKLSVAEKENVWILTSAGKIVWIVGMRPDDHFKITESTKKIIQITIMR
jgi:tRNA(Ile)-lysidine synthase